MYTKPWAVRIDHCGSPVGAGMLVARRWVLTCAHVVHDRPTDITVKFFGIKEALPAEAVVHQDWPNEDKFGDVAALKITVPDADGVAPCRFARGDGVMNRVGAGPLWAKGFPGGLRSGCHVGIETEWHREIEDEWLEISVVKPSLQLIEFGFSGAAVYAPDEHLTVVGMVASARMSARGKGAFEARMLPMASIRKHWATLEGVPELDWGSEPPGDSGPEPVWTDPPNAEGVLHQALPRISGRVISEQDRTDLLHLVQQLPRPALWEIYPKITGPAGRPLGPEAATLRGLIELVADLHVSDATIPPLLKLAEWQAGLVDDTEIQAKLRGWVDRVGRALEIGAEGLLALRRKIGRALSEDSAPSYLMVRLEPSHRPVRAGNDAPPRFQLGIWLWDGAGCRPIDADDFGELDLPGVESVFQDHWDDWVRSVDRARLGFEFLVPREHLGHGFDQWPIRLWDDETRLGREFPVTVRDATRLEPGRAGTHSEWRRRWTTLRQGGRTKVVCHPMTPLMLRTTIREADELVCIAIPTSPDSATDSVRRLVGAAFDAGLPAAIWVRGGHCELEPSLDEITAGPVMTLPAHVLKLRSQVDGDGEGHPGDRLTLVWDDPDRRIDTYPADLEQEV